MAKSPTRSPLEGSWKAVNGDPSLVLKGDESFTWGMLSGNWKLDGETLFLHSPGKLIGYTVKVTQGRMTLSGGDLYGTERVFTYASSGSPVIPAALKPAETVHGSGASRQNLTNDSSIPDTSLADLAGMRIQDPLYGVWESDNHTGHFDKLQFMASGQLIIDGSEKAGFRVIGDRIYVSRGEEIQEWFFVRDQDYLALSYSELSRPKLYNRMTVQPRRFRARSFEEIEGQYSSVRPVFEKEGSEALQRTIIILSNGDIKGWGTNKKGTTIDNWTAYSSIVDGGLEVRYDNGTLVALDVYVEQNPLFGNLLFFDGNVYANQVERPGSFSRQEWLDPYDAARIREELSDMILEVLPPIELRPDTTILQY